VRAPITFAYRNVVFGLGGEPWALFRLQGSPYPGASDDAKRALFAQLATWSDEIERDFQLLRVSRAWSVDDYVSSAGGIFDPAHGHPANWDALLDTHGDALDRQAIMVPQVFAAVRIAEDPPGLSQRLLGALESLTGIAGVVRDVVFKPAAGLSQRPLDGLLAEERRLFDRTTAFLDAERASSAEIEWLVRRSFCRGLGEPVVDGVGPQALVFASEEDELRYVPLEHDVLRLMDSPVTIGRRSLIVGCEGGESHQALLAVGALPEVAEFPGRRAELLFAPLEALDFPVDASLCAQFVANREAVALARRKIVDADNVYGEEARGDHGPSLSSAERPEAARELEDYLSSAGRPPLLRAAISLAVSAPSADELEDRVERLRREYAPVALHRPLGDQLPLFDQHLPGQRSRVPAYDDYLTVEQVGAMVPTAIRAVGSERGPYIGFTRSASRQPVLWDLAEASRNDLSPATLLVGVPGSGKTLLMQLLEYLGFLAGSRVVDIDPKGDGDHRLDRLPGLEGHVERVLLTSDEAYRGALDPFRVALPELREDLAVSSLFEVLPQPVPPEWKREVVAAVRATIAATENDGAPACCGAVVEQLLKASGDDARAVGETLAVYADSGLSRLAFGTPDSQLPEVGDRQVTMLGIRNLALPLPGTPRSDFTDEERIARALLRLLSALAMRLLLSDRSRHAVGGFDEMHQLLDDAARRRLIEAGHREARSMSATLLFASQTVPDSDLLENLIGSVFAFRMKSKGQVDRAVELLGHDPADSPLADRLVGLRSGECVVRDYRDRVDEVVIDPVDPDILDALRTTPDLPGNRPNTTHADAIGG
jgi:AAA domain-containing protein